MFRLFKISGDSLFPLLKNGNKVLARKIFKNTKINLNDMVVFENPHHGLMIKQVKKIEQGRYFVQGTSAFSLDSRDFGLLDLSLLKYKVCLTL